MAMLPAFYRAKWKNPAMPKSDGAEGSLNHACCVFLGGTDHVTPRYALAVRLRQPHDGDLEKSKDVLFVCHTATSLNSRHSKDDWFFLWFNHDFCVMGLCWRQFNYNFVRFWGLRRLGGRETSRPRTELDLHAAFRVTFMLLATES